MIQMKTFKPLTIILAIILTIMTGLLAHYRKNH